MNDSTRRRALESTARVALGCCLGATLGACGGQSVTDRVMEDEAQTEPNPSATAAPPTPPTPTATATTPTPEPTPTATGTTPTPVPTPTPTATTPPPTPTATTPPVPTSEPPAPPTPTLACLEPVTVVGTELAAPFTPEQKACCESYVESLVSAGKAPPAVTTVDPSLLNCCRALAYSTLWQINVTHETCCASDVLSRVDYGQPYCSPWGPPVPPAMVVA